MSAISFVLLWVKVVRFVPLIFVLVYSALFFAGKIIGISINSFVHAIFLAILFLPYCLGIFRLTFRTWISLMIIFILLATPSFFYIASGDSIFLGSGLISLILFGAAFAGYLSSQKDLSLGAVANSINIVFILNIIYILAETVILLFGGFDVLNNHLDDYRLIPGQPIYLILGLDSPGSPLGIKVSPQYSSQILILGIFWFLPIIKLPRAERMFRIFWFLVCVCLYPFCMTGTSLLMAIVMLIAIALFFPNSIFCDWIAKWRRPLSVVLCVFILVEAWSWPMYRLNSPGDLDFYMKVFLDPLISYGNLSLNQQVVGMKGDVSLISFTDFGYGAILWNSGALILCVFTALILYIVVQVILSAANKHQPEPFLAIIFLLAVQIVGWTLSLVHYPVAVENVGKVFFSLVIGGTIALLYGSNLKLVRVKF